VAVRDILNHFQVGSIKLISNNPRKLEQIELLGVKVTDRISAEVVVENSLASSYQLTKSLTMGHRFSSDHFAQVYCLLCQIFVCLFVCFFLLKYVN
jgi:hypothetical protein